MKKNSYNIAVVDDHAIVRQGLKLLINSNDNLELVGESDGSDNIVDLCVKTKPDLLMLDITLANTNGIELIKQIKKELKRWVKGYSVKDKRTGLTKA